MGARCFAGTYAGFGFLERGRLLVGSQLDLHGVESGMGEQELAVGAPVQELDCPVGCLSKLGQWRPRIEGWEEGQDYRGLMAPPWLQRP